MDDILLNFNHIRDRYVIVKLLKTLLDDIDFLVTNDAMGFDGEMRAKFIKIFHRFKHKILANSKQDQQSIKEAFSSKNHLKNAHLSKRVCPPKIAMKSKIVLRKTNISKLIRIKTKNRAAINNKNKTKSIQNQKSQINKKRKFRHFTQESMKIVECIVNNQKHKLHQFVTGTNASKSPSKTTRINRQTKRKNSMPPPPVFQPYNEQQPLDTNDDDNKQKKTDLDFSFLSSTLSSIQSALEVPKSVQNERTNTHQHDDDFSFDFQQISSPQNASNSVSPHQQPPPHYGYYQSAYNESNGYYANNNVNHYPPTSTQNVGGYNSNFYGSPPPKKKQKISSSNAGDSVIGNEQLTDLLSYLCTDDKNEDTQETADNLSPRSRYPKPKAPTMQDMNANNNTNSGWKNVVDRF